MLYQLQAPDHLGKLGVMLKEEEEASEEFINSLATATNTEASYHSTMEFEGTFNLGVDKLNRMIVHSRFLKTIEHV